MSLAGIAEHGIAYGGSIDGVSVRDGVFAVAGVVLGEAILQIGWPTISRQMAQGGFAARVSMVPAEFVGHGQPIHSGLAQYTFGLYQRGTSMTVEAGQRDQPTAGIRLQDRPVDKSRRWVPVAAYADGEPSAVISPTMLDAEQREHGYYTLVEAAAALALVAAEYELHGADLLPQIEMIGWTPITPAVPRGRGLA